MPTSTDFGTGNVVEGDLDEIEVPRRAHQQRSAGNKGPDSDLHKALLPAPLLEQKHRSPGGDRLWNGSNDSCDCSERRLCPLLWSLAGVCVVGGAVALFALFRDPPLPNNFACPSGNSTTARILSRRDCVPHNALAGPRVACLQGYCIAVLESPVLCHNKISVSIIPVVVACGR